MFPATSMPDRDWWQTLWPNPEMVVESIGLNSDMIVIDLCCGDGYFTIPLAKQVSEVYGLELDNNLLEAAKNAGNEAELSNLSWIHGDAMFIKELVPHEVDCVLIANTIHGVVSKDALIDSINNTLKPNGIFAVINWNKVDREQTRVFDIPRGPKTELRMSSEELTEMVLNHGFAFRKTIPVSQYHYLSVFEKCGR